MLSTLTCGPGDYDEVPNNRLFQAQAEEAAQAAKAASMALRGKRSKTAERQRRRVAKIQRHLASKQKLGLR